MADPAIRLGEEADRHETRLLAHVEPMGDAIGHGDQIVLDALDLVDLAIHVQGEQPRAGDEETDLIFLVEVLIQELLAQFGAVGVVRRDRGDVHALEAVRGDQAVDIGPVGSEHLVLAGARRDLMGRLPALEGDADRGQFGSDRLAIPAVEQRDIRSGVIKYAESAHGGGIEAKRERKGYQCGAGVGATH